MMIGSISIFPFNLRCRRYGFRQYELAEASPLIDLIPDSIPDIRIDLPFIDKARDAAIENQTWVYLHGFPIEGTLPRVIHHRYASCFLPGCGRLAAPFGTFNDNSSLGSELEIQQ